MSLSATSSSVPLRFFGPLSGATDLLRAPPFYSSLGIPTRPRPPFPSNPHRHTHRPRHQVSYIVFHYVTGVPFDLANNSGAYDGLTLWEQMDSGAQYTPAKKWFTTLPIVLFVLRPLSLSLKQRPRRGR